MSIRECHLNPSTWDSTFLPENSECFASLMLLVWKGIVNVRKCTDAAHSRAMQYSQWKSYFLTKNAYSQSYFCTFILITRTWLLYFSEAAAQERTGRRWSWEPSQWGPFSDWKLPSHTPAWQLTPFKSLPQQNLKLLQVRSLQRKERDVSCEESQSWMLNLESEASSRDGEMCLMWSGGKQHIF